MAITKAEVQITWAAANSQSVAAGGNATSDAFTFNAAAFSAMLTVKADNNGTPASGDTVDFYLLYTTGDPDGASTDEYDSTTQGTYLGQLDTFVTDPAQRTITVNPSAKGGKIYAVNSSAGRAITVSAVVYETRG